MADKNGGLISCCRYAYPPNSLRLCGPDAKTDLSYYSSLGFADLGTKEILGQFSTLYPYLLLIAVENSLSDPFNPRVIEAYWLGNSLLNKVSKRAYINHLTETVGLKRKVCKKDLNKILNKFYWRAFPHHSFHVLNIYQRTGHQNIPHTIASMDACLVNWGKIIEVLPDKIKVKSQRLAVSNNNLFMEKNIERTVRFQNADDRGAKKLKAGDIISCHWGILCQKISARQQKNLEYFTSLSIHLANTH